MAVSGDFWGLSGSSHDAALSFNFGHDSVSFLSDQHHAQNAPATPIMFEISTVLQGKLRLRLSEQWKPRGLSEDHEIHEQHVGFYVHVSSSRMKP